jgi:uncharacterized coiled-coil protein SlyX
MISDEELRGVVTQQQARIEKLVTAVDLLQRQLDALWRRVQDLEGVPSPIRNYPNNEHRAGDR